MFAVRNTILAQGGPLQEDEGDLTGLGACLLILGILRYVSIVLRSQICLAFLYYLCCRMDITIP